MVDPTAAALGVLFSRPLEARRIGPFRLRAEERLGHGGFAPVFVADEVYRGVAVRTVALKVFGLHPSPELPSARTAGGGSGGAPKVDALRIVEEARALCRVEHPNIVRFLSLATDDELGLMALAMEHLEGTPLSALLPLTTSETVRVGACIASALSTVHAAGLVHRDVKPANIIDVGGTYKLIDFGIAFGGVRREAGPPPSIADDAATRAKTHTLVQDFEVADYTFQATATFAAQRGGAELEGTLGYIDPACVRGAEPSTASDLYSLGATLYECLSGRTPARAAIERASVPESKRADVFFEVLWGEASPPPLREIREDTPPGIAAVIDALLSPSPLGRPTSAGEVAARLARAGDAAPEPVDRMESAPVATSTPASSMTHVSPPDDRTSSAWPRRWLPLAITGAVAISVAAYFAIRSNRVPENDLLHSRDTSDDVGPSPAKSSTPSTEVAPMRQGLPPEAPLERCPDATALVPAGEFEMGSDRGGDEDERPRHVVSVKSFCMDVTEVTVATYDRCRAADRCKALVQTGGLCNSGRTEQKDHPLNCVGWGEAAAFCDARGMRLPTEEEWEYAAAGGAEQRAFPWGNDPPSVEACWNGKGNDDGVGERRGTCAVGTHPAGRSRWGVDDLAGNVWEWVASPYCPYAGSCEDRSTRVIRGGAWFNDDASALRVANRYKSDPSSRAGGFRCVVSADKAGGAVDAPERR